MSLYLVGFIVIRKIVLSKGRFTIDEKLIQFMESDKDIVRIVIKRTDNS